MKKQGFRRYPALAYLVAAGALALLLPSGLIVPQSGPPTLAEYAPVPGQGQGSGDTSEFGLGASGGIGQAPGGDNAEAPQAGPGKVVRKAGTKRCVGNPPRQTEDPLSPPCIAFFDGDNGGATSRGVTKDEVTVVVKTNNTGTSPSDSDRGRVIDCVEPPTSNDTILESMCRSYQAYFNNRYQTYERKVHLYNVRYKDVVTDSELIGKYQPFAFVGTGSQGRPADKYLSVSYSGGDRAASVRDAPYRISYRPDDDEQRAQIATFICSKLNDRNARYAGDPTMQSKLRKFGLLSSTNKDRKDKLRDDLKSRCGMTFAGDAEENPPTTTIAQFQLAGVTTVILIVGNTHHATATNEASQSGYYPEWFLVGSGDQNGIDVNFHARTANQAQWANAFGITTDIRRDTLSNQPWYKAYKEGCGGTCPEPSTGGTGAFFASGTYDALSMLFYGVQAAGPKLSAANIDKGLHAIPPKSSTDPYRPAAYFAGRGYSFVKDAMAIWWDPLGRPPGASSAGCYRLPHDGRRFRTGEWLAGDDDIKLAGPCQADTFQ